MKRRVSPHSFAVMAAAMCLLACTAFAQTPPATTQPATPAAAAPDPVRDALRAALDELEKTGDPRDAERKVQSLFDQVIAHTPVTDRGLFVDAAHALRVVRLAGRGRTQTVRDRIAYLRKNPALSRDLAFLIIEPPADQDGRRMRRSPYEVLDALRETYPDRLDKFPALTAAVCVVHDVPLHRRINENTTEAATPAAIWKYFADNDARMLYGVRNMPAELLCYVVDTTTPIAEMSWALDKFRGNTQVGKLFFSIRYDYEYLSTGEEKLVTQKGFSLPNIQKFGGVCADQAYFAVAVGKSIGVPTAYTVGASGDNAHAWVGFFQAQGRRASWNFDVGRYQAFQGVRGICLDPQTRRAIPDGYVSLLAQLVGSKPEDRHAAVAFTDAAARLRQIQTTEGAFTPAPLDDAGKPGKAGDSAAASRKPGMDSQLELIDAAVRACPGHAPAWFALADLAATKEMTLEHKTRWADLLFKLTGEDYPDFTMTILAPMIASVEGTEKQNAMWEKAFALMQRQRADLAAEVRLAQGQMWDDSGDAKKAGQCYEDIINRYINAGPFVLEALNRTERALRDANLSSRVLVLYDRAFARVTPPAPMAADFKKQSNWYRIGSMYLERLEDAGLDKQAATLRDKIEQGLSDGKPTHRR